MKKTFTMIAVFLAILLPIQAAEESRNLHVVFNSRMLTGQVMNVAFTSRPVIGESVPGGQKAESNFKEFETFLPGEKVSSIMLDVRNASEGVVGIGAKPLYVSFQVYSSVPLKVVLRQSGPLCQNPDIPEKRIDWKVFLGSVDSTSSADSAEPGSSLVAYQSSPGKAGLSGSREIAIKTYPISPDLVGAYTASIIAEIVSVE